MLNSTKKKGKEVFMPMKDFQELGTEAKKHLTLAKEGCVGVETS